MSHYLLLARELALAKLSFARTAFLLDHVLIAAVGFDLGPIAMQPATQVIIKTSSPKEWTLDMLDYFISEYNCARLYN